MKKLFIVEAPGKVKSISAYLNQIEPGGWIVKASVGHIRDLHQDRFSIDLNTFRGAYAVYSDKKKVVAELIQVAKQCPGGVFLATDMDREGEAIAWHIAAVLKIDVKDTRRVEYNEISKSAIAEALKKTRPIDINRVVSQEARRFIDRIVGYTVSPMLHKVIKSKDSLSGGRVQSVVLMMVQERCHKIRDFKSIDYYGVKAGFGEASALPFKATWISERYHSDGYMLNKQLAVNLCDKIRQSPTFTVLDIVEKPVVVAPPKPFTTSLLQQVASKKLGMSIDGVMKTAQKLYEKGLISYMRTDSYYLSPDFIETVRNLIRDIASAKNMLEILPGAPNKFKSGANAQEAHEAIRPTKILTLPEEVEDPVERQLYQLIRDRTIACQMSAGQDLSTVIHVVHSSTNEPFVIKGRIVRFSGWRSLMGDQEDEDEAAKKDSPEKLPRLVVGETISADTAEVTSERTKPPAYFTQASLVQEMEKNNVGRPSTTASVIKVNFDRGYIEEQGVGKKVKIVITDLGDKVCDSLKGTFAFMDVKYTGQLEDALDLLASGRAKFIQIMSLFSETYEKNLLGFCKRHNLPETPLMSFSDDLTKSKAEQQLAKMPEGAVICLKCKAGYLRPITGKFGVFWGCSQNRSAKPCDATYPDFNGAPYTNKHTCPQCTKELRLDSNSGTASWRCVDKVGCGFNTLAKDDGSPKL